MTTTSPSSLTIPARINCQDTKYLAVGLRIQAFDSRNLEEVALVNKLQDHFVLRAESADAVPELKWDKSAQPAASSATASASTAYRFRRHDERGGGVEGPAAAPMRAPS